MYIRRREENVKRRPSTFKKRMRRKKSKSKHCMNKMSKRKEKDDWKISVSHIGDKPLLSTNQAVHLVNIQYNISIVPKPLNKMRISYSSFNMNCLAQCVACSKMAHLGLLGSAELKRKDPANPDCLSEKRNGSHLFDTEDWCQGLLRSLEI